MRCCGCMSANRAPNNTNTHAHALYFKRCSNILETKAHGLLNVKCLDGALFCFRTSAANNSCECECVCVQMIMGLAKGDVKSE